MSLLIDHSVEAADLILFLIDGPPEVLALIVDLIECPFEVVILGPPLGHLLTVFVDHLIPLPGHLLDIPLLLGDPVLLALEQVL